MMEAGDDGLYALEMLEVMRLCCSVCWRLTLYLLEVFEEPEDMRRVLLRMLEGVEGEFCLLEVMEVPEAIRCVLHCMLETVEGGLCLIGGVGRAGRVGRHALYAGGI